MRARRRRLAWGARAVEIKQPRAGRVRILRFACPRGGTPIPRSALPRVVVVDLARDHDAPLTRRHISPRERLDRRARSRSSSEIPSGDLSGSSRGRAGASTVGIEESRAGASDSALCLPSRRAAVAVSCGC